MPQTVVIAGQNALSVGSCNWCLWWFLFAMRCPWRNSSFQEQTKISIYSVCCKRDWTHRTKIHGIFRSSLKQNTGPYVQYFAFSCIYSPIEGKKPIGCIHYGTIYTQACEQDMKLSTWCIDCKCTIRIPRCVLSKRVKYIKKEWWSHVPSIIQGVVKGT